MGFGLYEAAFATATGLYGREARNAITGITLFAGFASTVGWPASALFIDAFGWRGACLTWAVLHLVIGLPMNLLLVPKARPHPPETAAGACRGARTMIVLAVVFGATGLSPRHSPPTYPGFLEAMGATPAPLTAAPHRPGTGRRASGRIWLPAPCLADDLGAAGGGAAPVGRALSGDVRRAGRSPSCCCTAPATVCSRSRAARCHSRYSGPPDMGCAPASSPPGAHSAGRRAAAVRYGAGSGRAALCVLFSGALTALRSSRSSCCLCLHQARSRPGRRRKQPPARYSPPGHRRLVARKFP